MADRWLVFGLGNPGDQYAKLYMNESGGPLKSLADFYKIPIDRVIVVQDEIDLPFGTIRIKQGGGDNGHNGLKDITSHFGGPGYFRIRLGVGRPSGTQAPADWVLKPFSGSEQKELPDFIARSAEAVERLIEKGLTLVQQEFN